MYIGLHVKYPFSLWDSNETLICSTDFRKILRYQISWKSFQLQPSCSTQADRRTDRDEEDNSCFFVILRMRQKNEYGCILMIKYGTKIIIKGSWHEKFSY